MLKAEIWSETRDLAYFFMNQNVQDLKTKPTARQSYCNLTERNFYGFKQRCFDKAAQKFISLRLHQQRNIEQ